MRRQSYENRRLMAGLSAMSMCTDQETKDEVARMFGIDELLAEARARKLTEKTSYVYIMDTHDIDRERYYKIGKSVHPHVRLKEMQSGRAAKMPPNWERGIAVRPLAIRLGGLALEATIHRDLREYRIRRTEWFAAKPEVSQYIVDQDAWDVWRGEQPAT
jgi:hypothetical protein